MRKLIPYLLCALLVTPLLFAAEVQKTALMAYNYDVDSATLTYVRMVGTNGDPYGSAISGTGTIKTAGSSTTVTENVAGSNPFTNVGVGDVIDVAPTSSTHNVVTVTARASAASITVDTAVDWSAGYVWKWWDTQTGTTATDGWVSVSGASTVGITVQYDQGDLDALKVRFECKGDWPGAAPVILYPGDSSDCGGGTLSAGFCEFATAGITSRITVIDTAPVFSDCRVGLAFKTTDTSDVGANLEKVTIAIVHGKFAQ